MPWLDVLRTEHEALHSPSAPLRSGPSTPLISGPSTSPTIRPSTPVHAGVSPIAALNAEVFGAGRSALCLSGGGIRSASFSVGVLQALARLGVVGRLDYLSTVSGGGFAGAWLTAWLYRARTDPAAARELEQLETGSRAAEDIEPEPVLRLRRYIRYMSPREGLFSADAWTLGATMIRNLLLNWLVLLPLLAAALLVPRLQYAFVHLSDRDLTPGLTFGWSDLETWVLLFAAAMYGSSLAFIVRDLPSYGNARRPQRIFLARCLLPLCLGSLALTYFWAVDRVPLSLAGIVGVSCVGHALVWIAVGFLSGRRAVRPRVWVAAVLSATVPAAGLYWLTQVVFPNGVELHAIYVGAAFPLVLSFILLGTLVFVGTAGADFDIADLEWWSRFGAWVLIAATVWLVTSAVVFGGPAAFDRASDAAGGWLNLHDAHASAVTGLLVPALGVVAGWMTRLTAARRTPPVVRRILLAVSGPAFVVALLATLSWGDERLVQALSGTPVLQQVTFGSDVCPPGEDAHAGALNCHPAAAGFVEVVVLGIVLLGFGVIMGRMIPVNKFSLAGMYRFRIVRSFLGASRAGRSPNPFTGFDPEDDFPIAELAAVRPLHVTNATLNMVAETELGQQERKGEPFTISPLHAGSAAVGYRPAAHYAADSHGCGITLGTAVTISGAAASPSMGMYSTPALTFLMTLLNARLGAWLGNPGPAGRDTWSHGEPGRGAKLVVDELLGRTTDQRPYVYLSDGGHFDNLGLVEMVRRRCRFIVVVDAGADPDYGFTDLANAVRRIRIDLGVGIELDALDISVARQGKGNPHCLTGTIHYDQVDGGNAVGTLVYLKPALSGDEPVDVRNYAAAHPAFPHESTLNQWFSEAQFESYRTLGMHTVEAIAGVDRGRPVTMPLGAAELCAAAIAYRQGLSTEASVGGVRV
jgi:predicted acylesterase/phospholipase RssA